MMEFKDKVLCILFVVEAVDVSQKRKKKKGGGYFHYLHGHRIERYYCGGTKMHYLRGYRRRARNSHASG
jgi:hypothetical protein